MNIIDKLKFYLISFFASPGKASEFHARKLISAYNLSVGAKFSLTDRAEEKLKAYKEWSKPENILARMAQLDAEAVIALDRGKAMSEFAKSQVIDLPRLETSVDDRLARAGIKVLH